jgi:hypothetical protein
VRRTDQAETFELEVPVGGDRPLLSYDNQQHLPFSP